MNRSQRTEFLLIALTFVGMVGLYVGGYYAWQQYQAYKAKLDTGAVKGALNLFGVTP